MERFGDPDEFFRDCRNKIFRGVKKRGEAFKLPVFATTDGSVPHARVLVLRDFDPEKFLLTAYTDIRTKKVADLKIFPDTTWTFWSKKHSLQVRVRGKSTVSHLTDEARLVWDTIPPKNRKDYCTLQAPGSLLKKNALPEWWGNEVEMTRDNTDYGFNNFGLIITKAMEIDALHLHPEGHQRARFTGKHQGWENVWLVP